MRRRVLLTIALLAFAPAALADPPLYSAKAIHGTVVDDVTGQPLAGVIVVAQWELTRELVPGLVNKSYGDRLAIVETSTDAQGRYEIAGWGPVPRPALMHLEHLDPSISFFTPGYYPWTVANEIRRSYSHDAVRASQWDGKTVRLRRFTGEPQEWDVQDGRFKTKARVSGSLRDYAGRLNDLQITLQWSKGNDDWKKYPRMVAALAAESERLQRAGLNPNDQIQPVAALQGGPESAGRFAGSIPEAAAEKSLNVTTPSAPVEAQSPR